MEAHVSSSDFFSVVSRDVAANPVARAIAKRRIESAIRDFLLELYFVEEIGRAHV